MFSLKERLLDDASVAALAETFKVLGDTTRVRILDALARAELSRLRPRRAARPDPVGRLASAAAAAQHAAGRSRRAGQHIYYALDDHHIVGLFEQGLEHVQERATAPAPGRTPRADASRTASRDEAR